MTEPMNPEDVPDELVGVAWEAFGYEHAPFMARIGNFTRAQIDAGELREADAQAEATNNDLMRALLAAVLPLDRQQQREAMGLREEWTLGDDIAPYDSGRILREADVRAEAGDPDSTSRPWTRDATEWREAESGGNDD